jgi:hypothetical protein
VYCAIAAPEDITTNPATLKLKYLFVIVNLPAFTLRPSGRASLKP